MLEAKCKEIRPILKEVDEDFDISFNCRTEKYTITHKGYHFMSIPYGKVNRKTIEHIRKTVYQNINGNVIDEIEKHNEKIDKSNERSLENLAESMAKDIRKPLIDFVDYGR